MSLTGLWIERLEAIAIGREVYAVGGRRDAAGVVKSRVHVAPISTLDGKGTGWSFDTASAVHALAFFGDELLVSGGDDGTLVAWEVTGGKQLAAFLAGGPVRAIAVDTACARGDSGTFAVARANGTVDLVAFAIQNGRPSFTATQRFELGEGPINAIACDPAGLWVAGGADGQLYVLSNGTSRAITPGGDGGIRAVACLGDGRAVIGNGDGSIRLCYVVGDVEPTDRSGDHGHTAAVRGLALGPVVVDDAGREQPRRLFSAGEDGAIKAWFVDGNRRPRTLEVGIGPLTALAFVAGPVAKVDKAAGRLWTTSAHRKVAALALDAGVDPVDGSQVVIGSLLDAHETLLRDGKAANKVKLEIVTQLADIAEDEARVLLDLALASGPVEVRVAATTAIVKSNRRASRPAVRAALAAKEPELRGAAFVALRELERDQPLVAIRAGLAVAYEDVRVRAVEALIPLAKTSIVAAGLVADALRDGHPSVRRRAFAALVQVAPTTLEAIQTTLSRGNPDVRAEALMYLALVAKLQDPAGRALAAGAFDDADPGVRTAAFLSAVLLRPRLAARLLPRVPSLLQATQQLAQNMGAAFAVPSDDGKPVDDDELEPLFAQLACRNADAAIRGAGSLLALGDPRAVGAVLQLTREADPALRRGATANLVLALATWPDDDRLSARLVWLLDDADTDVRSFAFDALAKTAAASGPGGELDLAELALRTSQEDIRVRALQILVRLGAPGGDAEIAQRAGHLLGDALDDEASKVRSEAFRTLWSWHAANPLVPLVRGAASRHSDLRMQVIQEIDRRRRASQSDAEMERILRGLVGDAVAQVGLAAYTALTREPDDGTEVKIEPAIHLAAMGSPAPSVRAAGAKGAEKAKGGDIRTRLVAMLKDDSPVVQQAAIEALDAVAPGDAEGFALAFASLYYDIQVRAGELCGKRRDEKGIAPMQRLLSIPKTDPDRPPPHIRHRAAAALADIGAPSTISFQQGLIEDEDALIREMAARGIATAAHPGDEKAMAALVALLGHADLPVRSWGGEGLAKLGDLRALPVLAGTQRHDHRPLRMGAIVGFVALGPDGVRGLRQGLEDRDREIQELAFAVIVARDVALASLGIAPDLLVDAVSSPSPEIRFTAARLFERRAAGEPLSAEIVGELVGPRRPDKSDKKAEKDWPPEQRRAAMLQVLADAIASDEPAQRYAAAQVLALRSQPLAFWREAGRLAGPSKGAPAPHTGFTFERRTQRRGGWLRRLVTERRDPEATELENLAKLFRRAGDTGGPPPGIDADATHRLVFGVYAGLVRQAPRRGEADETHRVRRDSIARLVELARTDAVGADAVLPVLGHAVGDPHHLVRQAAMAALRSLYPMGALAPLQMAIAGAADLGKAAIEELVERALEGDDRARALVRSALDADDADVREHAALRLQKLYPAGSVEPQILAAQSRHADVRSAAIGELASSKDPNPAIVDALVSALSSEHEDLRLEAAVALSERGKPEGIDVLAAFLRNDDKSWEALEALKGLASKPDSAGAAAEAIAARLLDDPDKTADRSGLMEALAEIAHPAGAPVLVRAMLDIAAGQEEEQTDDAEAAFQSLLPILRDPQKRPRELPDGRFRQSYREELALTQLAEAAKSPIASIRIKIASTLGDLDDHRADDVLARLLADRVPEVRVAAAEALALRVEYVPGATLAVLEAALRGGRRELVLPAALGLAAKKRPEAFQPLLLVAKAGEGNERERAILALGSLGDRRALDHLVPLLDPAPEDEASRQLAPFAIEAIGRLLPALTGDEAADMRHRVERIALGGAFQSRLHALTGLRYAGDLGILEKVAADREAQTDVREHAIRQLGLAASAASETVLVELLSDDDYTVYNAAHEALAKVIGADKTRLSLHALGSPHDDISGPAAKYLAKSGDPALLVEKLGKVKSEDVRRLLREGLIRRGTFPLPELTKALASADAIARAEASWLVGYAGADARMLGDAIASSVARSAADAARHPDDSPEHANAMTAYWAGLWAARRVGATGTVAIESAAHATVGDLELPAHLRVAAAQVLAAAGSSSGLDLLAKVIGDAEREVRTTASAALATKRPQAAAAAVRGEGSRADATTIVPLAFEEWPQLARELVTDASTRTWALAASLEGQRRADLLAIAKDKKLGKDPARLAAIATLGVLGGDDVLAALEAIHGDDSEDDAVKLAAWKALRRIGRSQGKTYAEGQDKGARGIKAGGGSSSRSDDDEDDDDDSYDDEDSDDEDSDDEDSDDEDSDDEDSDEDSDDEDSDDDDDDEDSDDEDSDDEDDEDSDDEDSDDEDEDEDEDDDDEDEDDE